MNVVLGSNGLVGTTRQSLTNLPCIFYNSKGKGLFELIDQPTLFGLGIIDLFDERKELCLFPGKLLIIQV